MISKRSFTSIYDNRGASTSRPLTIRHRFWIDVMVLMFGRETPVELEADQVQRV